MLVARALLFDFDYTLADSSEGIIECVRFACDRLGRDPIAPERVRATIGLSLADMWAAYGGDPSQARNFVDHYRQRAEQVMTDRTRLFDPVPEVIRELRARALPLGIVTSKYSRRVREILARDGLLDAFALVIGGEDVERPKPDPAGLRLAVDRLGCPAAQVVYVGDSVVDAEAAARAELAFVAVATGVTPAGEFSKYPVHAQLRDLSELPNLLERHDHD